MPSDPIVWIVLIVVAALVIALVAWKRGGVKFSHGASSLEITPPEQPEKTVVKVAEGAALENVEAGDVAGFKNTEIPSGQDIEVAKGALIKGTKLGDIVGVKQDK